MQITRRNFLHNIGALLGVAVVSGGLETAMGQKAPSSQLFPLPVEAYTDPLFSMTAKQFEALIGRDFSALLPTGRPAALMLSGVTPIDRLVNNTQGYYGETFSLMFEGRTRRKLYQDTYEFRGDGVAPFTALLVPVDRLSSRYEVIVSHLSR